ncbi:MAG: hypothetical protein AB7K64_12755 [Variibacter sp.]
MSRQIHRYIFETLYGRGVNPVFLPYPTAILAAFPPMLASGEIMSAFKSSLQSLVIGFSLAVVCSTALGTLMGVTASSTIFSICRSARCMRRRTWP